GFARQDRRTLPRRKTTFERETHPPAARPSAEQFGNPPVAGVASFPPPARWNGEPESGAYRIGRAVDIMPMEWQARFQAQRIARAKPGQAYLGFRMENLGYSLGFAGREGDLETILASISRPADPGLHAPDFERTAA